MIDYRENAIWSVYVHIVPKEISDYDYDKYYVGITKTEPEERWRNGSGYNGQLFYRAINKYGWDNIQHEVVADHLTVDEAKQMEIALIDKLGSCGKYGYNLTDGGDCRIDSVLADELEITNGIYVPVYQFTTEGDFIRRFNSIASAARITGISFNKIFEQLKYDTCIHVLDLNTIFIWRKEEHVYQKGDKYFLKVPTRVEYKFKSVCSFEKKTKKFIKRYANCKEASDDTGISQPTIHRSATKFSDCSESMYVFRFEKDLQKDKNGIYILKEKEETNRWAKEGRKVYQFDRITKEFIACYKTIKDAYEATKISNKLIIDMANNEITHSTIPYIWRDENGVAFNGTTYVITNLEWDDDRCAPAGSKLVYEFDGQGNYINKYLNVAEAARNTDCSQASIRKSAGKHVPVKDGQYNWRYEEDVQEPGENPGLFLC